MSDFERGEFSNYGDVRDDPKWRAAHQDALEKPMVNQAQPTSDRPQDRQPGGDEGELPYDQDRENDLLGAEIERTHPPANLGGGAFGKSAQPAVREDAYETYQKFLEAAVLEVEVQFAKIYGSNDFTWNDLRSLLSDFLLAELLKNRRRNPGEAL